MIRLTKASVTREAVVVLVSLLSVGVGIDSAMALKQELIPSFDIPSGSVVTTYTGASPEVVEAQCGLN